MEPSDYQKSVLERLSGGDGEKTEAPSKKRRRKGPKEPNPLSVKRSTKMRPSRKAMSTVGGGATHSKVYIIVLGSCISYYSLLV